MTAEYVGDLGPEGKKGSRGKVEGRDDPVQLGDFIWDMR